MMRLENETEHHTINKGENTPVHVINFDRAYLNPPKISIVSTKGKIETKTISNNSVTFTTESKKFSIEISVSE